MRRTKLLLSFLVFSLLIHGSHSLTCLHPFLHCSCSLVGASLALSPAYSFASTGCACSIVWHPFLSLLQGISFFVIDAWIAVTSEISTGLKSASKDAISGDARLEDGSSWDGMTRFLSLYFLFDSPEDLLGIRHTLSGWGSYGNFFSTVVETIHVLLKWLLLNDFVTVARVNAEEFVDWSWWYGLRNRRYALQLAFIDIWIWSDNGSIFSFYCPNLPWRRYLSHAALQQQWRRYRGDLRCGGYILHLMRCWI